jgi:hypothetical protein
MSVYRCLYYLISVHLSSKSYICNKIKSMKKIYVLASLAFTVNAFAQGVGISSSSITPDPSAILELRSTTQGLLFPRTTTGSISSPAQGLMIFNTTTNQFSYYDGSAWQAILGGGNGITSLNGLTGSTQAFANGTNVTITSAGTTHTLGWTGQLSVANGGTGLAAGTSGGILGYTASGTLASSGLLTQNALLLGGGAGATPTALGSLGTTTSVLHGNVAGAPTYGAVVLTTDVSGILPVANGGTGSAVQNYVDLTTAQTAAGAKTWSGLGTFNAGITSTGAAINLNASSNFATNINTGTSTGAVTIGGTVAQTIAIGNGVAGNTINIADGANTTAQTINIGSGANAANNTIKIGAGVNTAGVTAITIGSTAALANSLTLEAGTGAITFGNSANARTWNVGAGNAIQTVNLFNNATPANIIKIGGAASTTTIGSIKNTIGIAGVANGDGVRIGNGRVTINKPTAPTVGLNANTTATVTEILDAGIIGFASALGRNLTLPTAQGAAGLVQALPGTPAVGDVFTFEVFNTGAGAITLVAGAGITIVNTNTISSTGGNRIVYCRVTSIAAGAETISIY